MYTNRTANTTSTPNAEHTANLDVTKKLDEFRNTQIQKILASISQNGISPVSKIKPDCPINIAMGSKESQQTVCVNYLDLKDCSQTERQAAIHEAVWEEYMGILGISLERAWPFTFFKTDKYLALQEIKSRMYSNVVFVIKPPTKPYVTPSKTTTTYRGYTTQKCYQNPSATSDDGFSQKRGISLNSGKKINHQATDGNKN